MRYCSNALLAQHLLTAFMPQAFLPLLLLISCPQRELKMNPYSPKKDKLKEAVHVALPVENS